MPAASPALAGVYPILATPFRPDASVDEADLCRLVDFIVAAGADGLVFPGVASEFETLGNDERQHLVEVVARHEPDEALRGRYEAMYGIYRDSARATADINHRLAAVERG